MAHLYDPRVLRFGPRVFHQDPHLSRISAIRIPQVVREQIPPTGGGAPPANPPATPPADPPARVFTQAEVDAMIASRGEQWARQNFPDYDKHKKATEELETIRAANQTETEKAIQKAKSEGKTEAEQAAAGALAAREAQYATTLLRAEIKSQAAGLNFADPTDVVALLQSEYLGKVKLDKDGELTGHDGLDERLKKLAKDKPYLVKGAATANGTPIPGGGGGPPGSETPEDKRKAADNNARVLLSGGYGRPVRRVGRTG